MTAQEAFLAAVAAHESQNDKGGVPYIFHPIAVAEAVRALGEDYEVVAFMHDVFEDTPAKPDDFPLTQTQRNALAAITRRDNEAYSFYIRRVKQDFIARVVKIADLRHNLSPERQDALSAEEAASLATRYRKTLRVLEGAE